MNQLRHAIKTKRGEDSSFTIQQGVLMVMAFIALGVTLQAAQPLWWTTTGGPLNSNPANDYQVANQGQLKQFTQKAVLYMNTNLPGGAGTNLNNLVTGWSNYYATNGYSSTNPAPADFKAINQGQLKYIGNLVWAQLVADGYTFNTPSWLALNTNNEYKVANVGQLKSIFNFDYLADSDTNGLPDWWEMKYFGAIGSVTGYNTNSSPDGNGLTLLQDYTQGNNPTNYYSQGGSNIVPTIALLSGDSQTNSPGQFTDQPLVVSVVNSVGGSVLTNAPVIFSVTSGGGQVGTPPYGGAGSALTATTDSSGHAQAYYQNGSSNNVISTIVATTGGHSVSFHAATSVGDGTFDAPDNIQAGAAGPTEIDLAWFNHASAATSIVIQSSTDNATWTTLATLSDPTATNYAATGLTAGQSYYFRIAGSR